MKKHYLFCLDDGRTRTLYSIVSDNEETAKNRFIKISIPILKSNLFWNDFVNMFREIDIAIDYLGTEEDIIEVA